MKSLQQQDLHICVAGGDYYCLKGFEGISAFVPQISFRGLLLQQG